VFQTIIYLKVFLSDKYLLKRYIFNKWQKVAIQTYYWKSSKFSILYKPSNRYLLSWIV